MLEFFGLIGEVGVDLQSVEGVRDLNTRVLRGGKDERALLVLRRQEDQLGVLFQKRLARAGVEDLEQGALQRLLSDGVCDHGVRDGVGAL